MKRHQLQRLAFFAGAIFALQFQNVIVVAGQIRYSWSGRLVPDGSDDPWQIGEQDQPFVLDVAVSLDAPDLFEVNVEFAAFDADDVKFLLDGQEIPYLGNGNVDFTDNWSGLFDLLVFHGDFEQLGQAIEIGSLVVLPLATFQFSHTIEHPPFFNSTTEGSGGTCCGGTYTSIVAAGTLVSVVAEPASVALLAVSSLIYVFRSAVKTRIQKTSE